METKTSKGKAGTVEVLLVMLKGSKLSIVLDGMLVR